MYSVIVKSYQIWTAARQNQQNDTCAQRRLRSAWASTQSDHCALIGSYGPNVSSCGQRRLWSDWADAQADLSLRWAHRWFYWFCHVAAHLWFLAHLSRRLTRWAYRMGLEPASVRPHFQTWISPRPAGRLQPNFIWSIIGVGERLH